MKNAIASVIRAQWRDSIIPALQDFIRIPNLSPVFDPDWHQHGHMNRAVELIAGWCRARPIPGLYVQVLRPEGLTPLVVAEIPGDRPGTVLLYGHLDKQPEFSGWQEGLSAWQPVIRDGKLYGRGGADDGYAAFSSLGAIEALKAQGVRLPRCVLLIEATEESGSIHLPAHLQALGDFLGSPGLVICLDAEAGNYEQLWCTTSLRGIVNGTLRVKVLTEGVHSGMGTGIAATPMRIATQLLARVENPVTGDVLLEDLHVPIPEDRTAQIRTAAAVLGDSIAHKLPFAPGVEALSNDPVELLLANTWRPSLAITGAEGLPPLASAGNVLLPEVALKLSLRLAPTSDATRAAASLRSLLESDPPYGARVSFESEGASSGWNAPAFAPWLEQAIAAASREVFGRSAVHLGAGGTIPFMGMLGERFPHTQFFITGVLGPQSNAHGPNEFLHLDYAQDLTVCVALVLAAFPAADH